MTRHTTVAALVLLAQLVNASWAAQEPAPPTEELPEEQPSASVEAKTDDGDDLPEDRHIRWLEQVDPLITLDERAAFLGLTRDHHRDAFIRKFWQIRDPYPQTGRNELKERWDDRLFELQNQYGSLDDDRARIYLVHGPPHASMEVRCTTTRTPVIVWQYNGSDSVQFPFILVFVRQEGLGLARIWQPGLGNLDRMIENSRRCLNGNRLDGILGGLAGRGSAYERTLARVLAKPRPASEEWLATFNAFSSDIPDSAPTFEADVRIDFLGRVQSRTVAQTLVLVDPSQAGVEEYAGFRSYNFEVTGEVVKDGELFENFRYKFGVAEEEAPPEGIPMAFQRYLRPGDYSIIFKVEDLARDAYFSHEQQLAVPRMEKLADIRDDRDSESMILFREAAEAVGSEETAIRLVPPPGELHSGFVRFDTLSSGGEIEKVVFFLDDRAAVTKNRPPYNVEIDLGPFPRTRSLRAAAMNDEGRVVAEDEILLNAGEHRFAVRLVEPHPGGSYETSLRARAEIDLPRGRTLERVDFFLDEQPIASLYQEPFVQPIRLNSPNALSYVRAVAYLVDGNSTEDVVFINSPDYLEQIDVQFVELYAAALDDEGRLVDGLAAEDFRVFEDGTEQTITRFDKVENLPFHSVILIDNSASMMGALGQARHAALSFFQQAITPKDRAAVITFNRFPDIAVKFTNDHTDLGSGLQGLTAEGQTALYDSLMFSLYYFTGIKGQRAILLLSDGKDEVSRFGYADTLDYARRAGVTIYSIGLQMNDGGARRKLISLANETGGRSYFIDNIKDLATVYDLIQQDLRSQYFIAYQSSNTGASEDFRFIDLRVERPRTNVRTLAGYYP
jgi:Ca-activated chloride channel family protein